MTTKRRTRGGAIDARPNEQLDRARRQLAELEQQATLCEWIDTVNHRMGPIKQEIAAIGALIRDHNLARAHLIEVELATPEFVAASKAVFAIQPVADRAAELTGELDGARERHLTAQARLSAATARSEEAQARSEDEAARRWPPWGKGARQQAQWVATTRAAAAVTAAQAAVDEANEAFQPLAAEADMLDIELESFRRTNGGTPQEVSEQVAEHRASVKDAREALRTLEALITERREALELQLHSHLRRAQQWGLIEVIPDGADAMADAMEQTRDVALLETAQVDCGELPAQLAAALAAVRRLESA